MRQLDKGYKMKNVNAGDIIKIVQDYSGYIKSLSHKYYVAGGTSEDLYQEGIIGLLEACNDYNGDNLFEKNFEYFAKMCVKRQMFDAIRKAQKGGNVALNSSVSLVGVSESGDEISKLEILVDRTTISDPLEIFIDREKYYDKMKFLEKELSDFEKQVLNHYLDGEKQSEIAVFLNKSVKSIDNTLQRIKSKVK